jgi:tripartite ATP-independent transporter DctP family solute receptor
MKRKYEYLMKKTLLLFVLVVVGIVPAVTLTPALAAGKPIIIKLAHVTMPDPMKSPFETACYAFKQAVEQMTNGRFEVRIYPGGTLGKELDLMEAVRTNQIQAHLATPGGLYRVFPPAFLYSTPFMFRNVAVAMAVVDGGFSKKIVEAFTAKTGIKALTILDLGCFAKITNNVHPIKSPADVKGIKFRAMDQLQIIQFQSLGGSAVPISWNEVYTALQTGVVQGQLNPAFIINLAKLYEVQKYMTVIKAAYSPLMLVVNKKWYDALSPEDKRVMRLASIHAKTAARGMGMLIEGIAFDKLKEKGVEVTILSESTNNEFAKIVRPKCLEWFKKKVGPEWIEGLIKATREAEAKLGY